MEEGALLDLCTSLQVTKPLALDKVTDQVNEAELHEEICHALAPRALDVVQVHVNITKDNEVRAPEAMQGLLEV